MAARYCSTALFRLTRLSPASTRQCHRQYMLHYYCRTVCSRMTFSTSFQEQSDGVNGDGIPQHTEGRSPRPSRNTSTIVLQDEPLQIPKAPSSHSSSSFLYDELASKFINCMMWEGKKSLAQRLFKGALEIIKQKQLSRKVAGEKGDIELDPLVVFHQAVANAKPLMGTIGIRKGGNYYHVPVALPEKRRRFLAIKWLITAARERKGKAGMSQNLAAELLDSYNNTGTVIKKKQDLHRLAEVNRAFAHYRWM